MGYKRDAYDEVIDVAGSAWPSTRFPPGTASTADRARQIACSLNSRSLIWHLSIVVDVTERAELYSAHVRDRMRALASVERMEAMANAETPGRIPLVVVEEHHEAYLVWRHAIRAGWIRPSRNELVHFDEHHDLCIPVLRTPLTAVQDPEQVAAFTYGELGIGCFIWPAVHAGTIDRCFWVRRNRTSGKAFQTLQIEPRDERELEFIVRNSKTAANLHLLRLDPADRVFPMDPYILDIDLDYFICNKPRPRFSIEITKAAYERYLAEPYYYIRIPSPEVTVEARNGSYYISIGDDPVPDPDLADASEIDRRVEEACDYVAAAPAAPALVVVCRSVYSGYTPAAQASYLIQRLLDRLSAHVPIERVDFRALLPTDTTLQDLLARRYVPESMRSRARQQRDTEAPAVEARPF